MRSRASTTPSSEAVLIVFARAPVAGKAKTRLAAAIGADAAAQLHARLVERALATALAARTGRVELYCTPDVRHPFFARIASRLGVPLRSQGRGDVGARMQRALARALRTAPAAVLIGCDCPVLRAPDLPILVARGLLDDRVFAERYAAARARRGMGPARLIRDLMAQGVDGRLAEGAVREGRAAEEIDVCEEARRLASRRLAALGDLAVPERRRRLATYLQRRRYATADALLVARELCPNF